MLPCHRGRAGSMYHQGNTSRITSHLTEEIILLVQSVYVSVYPVSWGFILTRQAFSWYIDWAFGVHHWSCGVVRIRKKIDRRHAGRQKFWSECDKKIWSEAFWEKKLCSWKSGPRPPQMVNGWPFILVIQLVWQMENEFNQHGLIGMQLETLPPSQCM